MAVVGVTVVPSAPLPTMRAELARYCWMRSSSQLPCISSSFLSDSTSSRSDLAVCVSAWCSVLMARSVASSSATATLLFARHRLAASRLRARGSDGAAWAAACVMVCCEEGPAWGGAEGAVLVVAVVVGVVAAVVFRWGLELPSFFLLFFFLLSSLGPATAIVAGAIGTCGADNPGDELFR